MLLILYRNIPLLSVGFNNTKSSGSIKAATVFDIVVVAVIASIGILVKTETIHLSENQETLFVAVLVSVIMIVIGIISPRLPYNRHTGL